MIYDFSNRPVPHCEVSLGWFHKTTTDINGRFTFPRVSLGTYTITGKKTGFESYSEQIIIKDIGQIVYIRMPSQNQLLNLVDEALTANNLTLAEETVERAYQIDENNIEMLFYYATVKFRQRRYGNAMDYLETAIDLGSKDLYVLKFLVLLKELS
jgi:tetratricopeptide (TPR) repeat protein